MAYIFGLVIVALLFLALHYFTEITKEQKVVVSVVILVAIFGAISYNKYNEQQRKTMLNVVTTFNQGKNVKCDSKIVNNKNYTLSIGTYTFIGKDKTPFYGEMISASGCSK